MAAALLLLGACDFPKDGAGTLERVRGGELRVGIIENAPWVRIADGRGEGVEPTLVAGWAQRLGARVTWVRGGMRELVEALDRHEIDLLVAGLESGTPFKSKLGLSQPYLTTRVRIAVSAAQAPPEDWEGLRVAIKPGRVDLPALLREQGAQPVELREWRALPVAGYEFELQAPGLQFAEPVLATEEHVMAVSAGENAFLLALDKYLGSLDRGRLRELAAKEAAR